jgi:hypothetical protein
MGARPILPAPAPTIAFQFEKQPRKASGRSFNFLKKIRLEKNREIFSILQSHNKLSARNLHKLQLFAVDNSLVAALLTHWQAFGRRHGLAGN